jgi:hypothetical protein
MNVSAANMNADANAGSISLKCFKPARRSSVSSATHLSRDVIMAKKISRKPRFAIAFASTALALLQAGHAFASQGPGGGPGTASAITQLAMAILVYGASAAIIAAGLIGALRQR